MEIPPIHVTFPRSTYLIKTKDYKEGLRKEFSGATINYLENVSEQDESPHEQLPQLTIGVLEDGSSRFVRKLAEREELENWKIHEVPIVLKKGNDQYKGQHCV